MIFLQTMPIRDSNFSVVNLIRIQFVGFVDIVPFDKKKLIQ